MEKLSNVVLVLGASDRLGRAIALHLSECGYDIIIHYHVDETGARKTLSMIEKSGGVASLLQGDITKSEGIKVLFTTLSSLSSLCSIVNCTSVFVDASIDSIDEDRFDTDQAIHQKSPFFLSQALYRYSKEHNLYTSLIHLTDAGINHPGIKRPSYYIAKSALEAQIKIVALAVAPYVRINGVAPGLIISNNEKEEAYFKKREEEIPLKRLATIIDVASVVKFLIKNKAITGQIIRVDSGESLL